MTETVVRISSFINLYLAWCVCIYSIILSCSFRLRDHWSRFIIIPEGQEECYLLGNLSSLSGCGSLFLVKVFLGDV